MMHFYGTKLWKGPGSAAAPDVTGSGAWGSPLRSGGAWALVIWPLGAGPVEHPHKISIILEFKYKTS